MLTVHQDELDVTPIVFMFVGEAVNVLLDAAAGVYDVPAERVRLDVPAS